VPSQRAARMIGALVEAKNYDALDGIARQLNKETEPFAWDPQEAPYDILIKKICGRPDALPRLEKWAEEDKDALLPKVLLADRYISEAWAHRGGGPASSVTAAGWEGFRKNITKAREILEPICKRPDAPSPARTRLLIVAMAQSWPDEEWLPQTDLLLKNSPRYVRGQCQVVQMLLPRWGGTPGASGKYAARVADAIGGVDGDAMYARMWLSTYDLHGKQDSIVSEMEMDFERVKKGLTQLAEKSWNPNYFAHRGLQVSFQRSDKAAAQAFLALLKDPQNSWEIHWWRHPGEVATAIRYAKDGTTP
jgi:hypothetical protein